MKTKFVLDDAERIRLRESKRASRARDKRLFEIETSYGYDKPENYESKKLSIYLRKSVADDLKEISAYFPLTKKSTTMLINQFLAARIAEVKTILRETSNEIEKSPEQRSEILADSLEAVLSGVRL